MSVFQSRADEADTEATDHTDLLGHCESPGDVMSLNGETISEEIIEDGDRVREKRVEVSTIPGRVVSIESSDTVVYIRNGKLWKMNKIIDIGDDVSESSGLHVELERDGRENDTLHLGLVQRWLDKRQIVVVGTRTSEHANVE